MASYKAHGFKMRYLLTSLKASNAILHYLIVSNSINTHHIQFQFNGTVVIQYYKSHHNFYTYKYIS